LIIILAIRLDSPGPVFYKQLRVGKNGRFFMVWKFRSMTYTSKKGTLLTEANDSRITRTGHILRRLSLDELPNFINVLKGEMSLIGPRPEVPEITEHYTKFQKKVFRVRPGITGFSQIIFRQEITVDRKMRFDNWYIAHRSFCLYLWIVIMTPVVIFTNKGNR
jgi:lipopolysaccharide/colanic/teichoic acid biosynthesis glycosyltransferase